MRDERLLLVLGLWIFAAVAPGAAARHPCPCHETIAVDGHTRHGAAVFGFGQMPAPAVTQIMDKHVIVIA